MKVNKIKIFAMCIFSVWLYDSIGCTLIAVPYPKEASLDADELITRNGYPLEIHYVTTKDGYILKVHRIPLRPQCKGARKKKPYPLIAVHGLAMSSRTFAVVRKGFAFLAADHCYDVWLPNTRGTYESRNHTSLNPNKAEFWQFDVYEKAVYDVPAVIDYVLQETNATQVQYLGHSQGTSAVFILGSLFPEYSVKTIRSIHALAPVVFTVNAKTLLYTMFSSYLPVVQKLFKKWGIFEFPRSTIIVPLFSRLFCRLQEPTLLNLCAQLSFFLAGDGEQNFNATSFLALLGFFPSGISARELFLGAQLKESGIPQRYNFYEDNVKVYGQPTPPAYPIDKVRVPSYLYAAHNDIVADFADVNLLSNLVSTSIIVNNSEFSNFNHLDFIAGKNVDIVNNMVIENLSVHD